jgi:putative addiction module component (TIGR02574 family)
MSAQAKKIIEEIRSLSPEDRRLVALEFVDDADDEMDGSTEEVEKAWALEIERRVAEVDAGLVTPVPFEDALARIEASLSR